MLMVFCKFTNIIRVSKLGEETGEKSRLLFQEVYTPRLVMAMYIIGQSQVSFIICLDVLFSCYDIDFHGNTLVPRDSELIMEETYNFVGRFCCSVESSLRYYLVLLGVYLLRFNKFINNIEFLEYDLIFNSLVSQISMMFFL